MNLLTILKRSILEGSDAISLSLVKLSYKDRQNTKQAAKNSELLRQGYQHYPPVKDSRLCTRCHKEQNLLLILALPIIFKMQTDLSMPYLKSVDAAFLFDC